MEHNNNEPWNLKEDRPVMDGVRFVAGLIGMLILLVLFGGGFIILDAVMTCPK